MYPLDTTFEALGLRYDLKYGARSRLKKDPREDLTDRLRRIGQATHRWEERKAHIRSLVLPKLVWAAPHAMEEHDLKDLTAEVVKAYFSPVKRMANPGIMRQVLLEERCHPEHEYEAAKLRYLARKVAQQAYEPSWQG